MTEPCKNKSVLLVRCIGSDSHRLFESQGIELLSAETSDQALDILSTRAVDAIVADVQMSDVAWLSEVRHRFDDLIIIVAIGFGNGYLITDTELGRIVTTIISQPYEDKDIALAVRYAFLRQAMSTSHEVMNTDSHARAPRVLVADDSEDMRRLISKKLQKRNFEITCADDGLAAIEAFEAGDFDIVLTDIQMPQVNGIELTRKIKQLKPRTPVIVMSAHGEVEVSLEAMRAGAYCYVLKPVDFRELMLFMDRAMLADRLESQLREQNDVLDIKTQELGKALNELRQQAELQAASRLSTVKRLSANVAHELKNPINSISASFFYVRSQIPPGAIADNPKITKHCDIIEAQIQRSKNIIEGMMDFARPDMANDAEVQINDVVSESVKLALLAYDGIEVRLELESGLGLMKACESKLKMVFQNIVINAAKAMKNAGVLTVTTESDGDAGVRIAFADTGPGLPDSIMYKIFDPFFTTDHNQGGTGLGLAICRETVKQCGGSITVENAPTGGAVFTVTLPHVVQEVREEVLAC